MELGESNPGEPEIHVLRRLVNKEYELNDTFLAETEASNDDHMTEKNPRSLQIWIHNLPGEPQARKVTTIPENTFPEPEELGKGQKVDPALQNLYRYHETNEEISDEDFSRAGKEEKFLWKNRDLFELVKGQLIFRRSAEEDPRLVIPRDLRRLVIELNHDLPFAAHLGVEKTAQRIKKKFFLVRNVKGYWHICNRM